MRYLLREGYPLKSVIGLIPVFPFCLALIFEQIFVSTFMYGNIFTNMPSLLIIILIFFNLFSYFIYLFLLKNGTIAIIFSKIQIYLKNNYKNNNNHSKQIFIANIENNLSFIVFYFLFFFFTQNIFKKKFFFFCLKI